MSNGINNNCYQFHRFQPSETPLTVIMHFKLSEADAFWKKPPSETLAFPALLPMIPGMYAYGIFQHIFKVLSSAHAPGMYCDVLIYNLLMALLVILMLVSGVFLSKMLRGVKKGKSRLQDRL